MPPGDTGGSALTGSEGVVEELFVLLQDIVDEEAKFIPALFFGVATIWVLIGSIGKTVRHGSKERTRREIAAYIAEGSMTPEQGERLMRAGDRRA